MVAQLAAEDPETLEFESTVTETFDDAVALDRTYFYAESGGQPSDRGTIDDVAVDAVYKYNGTTFHQLADSAAFEVGDTVRGAIDPAFRRYCMVAHTASHAVYGAARQRFETVGYGGFEITPEKVRIDFRTPTPIDDEELIALERLTNEVVWEDRPVTWDDWPAAEVRAHDDIALNVATEVVETEEYVRVVQIEDWDIAACGGTHLRSTGDIGAIAMRDRSNPGEGLTRVEFVVGQDRIDRHVAEKRAALAAKRELDAVIEEVPERLHQLQRERQELESTVAELETRLVRAKLESPDATRVSVDGRTWVLAAVDDVDANALRRVAEVARGDLADVIVAATGSNRTTLVVETPGEPAATRIVDAVLEEVEGGGGGGSDRSAQAGGIPATPDAIIDTVVDRFAE